MHLSGYDRHPDEAEGAQYPHQPDDNVSISCSKAKYIKEFNWVAKINSFDCVSVTFQLELTSELQLLCKAGLNTGCTIYIFIGACNILRHFYLF